jgi:vacuolar protein sorting-associated protein 72
MSADAPAPEPAPTEPRQQEDAHEPVRFENRTTSDSDSDSDSDGPAEARPATEWLATTRQKRSTAGNRMQSMLANEEPDSDLELLFAEDEDDRGFTDDDGADSDVQMDSSSDDEDDNKAGGDDELEGEKELEQQAKERRAAQRKRKAQAAIPAKFRKKVRIDDSKPSSVAASSPAPSVSTPQSQSQPAPRPKKKSERASWLPSIADMPTRASSRKTTRLSKEQLHAQMEEREAKRLKQADQMAKKAARAAALKKPPMTQEERLREAELVERRNSKSLNRWEEAEKQREEERLAKLAALNNRTLKGPVLTFWSGTRQWDDSAAGKYVVMEEKPKRKREKKDKDTKSKEKGKGKDGDKVDGDAEANKADNKPGETPDQEPKTTANNGPLESEEATGKSQEIRETKAGSAENGQPDASAEANAPASEPKLGPTSQGSQETIQKTTEESTSATKSSSPGAALASPIIDDEKTAAMTGPSDSKSPKPTMAVTVSTEATSTSAQTTEASEPMGVSIGDSVIAASARIDTDGDTTMAEDAEASELKLPSMAAAPAPASPRGPDAMDADPAPVAQPSEDDTAKSNELAPPTIGTATAASRKDESSNTTPTNVDQTTSIPPATAKASAPVNTEVKANITAIDAGEVIKPKAEGDKATSVAPGGTPSEPPQPPTGEGDSAEKRAESTAIRNTIIFQNFDENAIRDKTVQTQILFGRKMNKLPSKFACRPFFAT